MQHPELPERKKSLFLLFFIFFFLFCSLPARSADVGIDVSALGSRGGTLILGRGWIESRKEVGLTFS